MFLPIEDGLLDCHPKQKRLKSEVVFLTLLLHAEEIEAKENKGTANSEGQPQASPPRQPFRTSQVPQYQSQRPWGQCQPGPQSKAWGQPQPQNHPWPQHQPKQHPWGQQPSQAGRAPQWGQGAVGDRAAKRGSDQLQGSAAGPRDQTAIPARHQTADWAANQSQGQAGAAGVPRDVEGWSDAVPVLSAESSASMVRVYTEKLNTNTFRRVNVLHCEVFCSCITLR